MRAGLLRSHVDSGLATLARLNTGFFPPIPSRRRLCSTHLRIIYARPVLFCFFYLREDTILPQESPSPPALLCSSLFSLFLHPPFPSLSLFIFPVLHFFFPSFFPFVLALLPLLSICSLFLSFFLPPTHFSFIFHSFHLSALLIVYLFLAFLHFLSFYPNLLPSFISPFFADYPFITSSLLHPLLPSFLLSVLFLFSFSIFSCPSSVPLRFYFHSSLSSILFSFFPLLSPYFHSPLSSVLSPCFLFSCTFTPLRLADPSPFGANKAHHSVLLSV